MLDQFHVTLDGERRVFIDGMKWREKNSVAKLHDVFP
jgi:hypothetical protein